MVTTFDTIPNSWIGGLTGGGVTQGQTSGYLGATTKQNPYISVNFVGNGDLNFELAALKTLVGQLEHEIESSFGKQSSGEFRSYSRTFSSPGRSESYSFGA